MSVIDWNDPDITSKYRTRGGDPILAVHCPPEWARITTSRFPVTVRHANGGLYLHSLDGRFCRKPHPLDIVPIPRDPITVEGWVASYASLGSNSFGVLIRDEKPSDGWVRVKVTEVIE